MKRSSVCVGGRRRARQGELICQLVQRVWERIWSTACSISFKMKMVSSVGGVQADWKRSSSILSFTFESLHNLSLGLAKSLKQSIIGYMSSERLLTP